MKTVRIPKGGGAYRTVYVPSPAEKAALRRLLPDLEARAARACPPGVCHGFARGRSPVTNAAAHVGRSFTLSFDLADFFDSVTAETLGGLLPPRLLARVLVDGAARQGLPTSPAVANLAASRLDRLVLALRARGADFTYTRYADDLAFSYDDPALTDVLLAEVPAAALACGFRVNDRKTRLQAAAAGRRVVTGVAVGPDGLYPTRAARRRLRAALHRGDPRAAAGLAEWCRLVPPRPAGSSPPDVFVFPLA